MTTTTCAWIIRVHNYSKTLAETILRYFVIYTYILFLQVKITRSAISSWPVKTVSKTSSDRNSTVQHLELDTIVPKSQSSLTAPICTGPPSAHRILQVKRQKLLYDSIMIIYIYDKWLGLLFILIFGNTADLIDLRSILFVCAKWVSTYTLLYDVWSKVCFLWR